jgi:leucyl aminopeptidase (aminopeptidase T)
VVGLASDLPSVLDQIATRAVRDYLSVCRDEQVVILVDGGTSPSIAVALATAVSAAGAEPVIITITARTFSGAELPKSVLAAVTSANVVISACSRSPYHSSLKVLAQEAGVRGTLNSPPDEAGWIAGAMTIDFRELRPVAAALRRILSEGSRARVRNPMGTDLTMSIAGRQAVGWLCGIAGEPSQTVAWPGGEVSLPPVEGTAEGQVVVQVAMTDIGAVGEPLVWTVERGLCVKIDGGEEASRLRRVIRGVPDATNIGELGIGINPAARLVPDITEAKKRRGTAHIALGDSANGYGGNVNCALHLDGLVPDVTVEIDDQVVVADGVLQFDF